MNTTGKIESFIYLGKSLENLIEISKNQSSDFSKLLSKISTINPWFTKLNIRTAITSISQNLKEEKLNTWLHNYSLPHPNQPTHSKTIGVVMAGNIPLVGFHDFLCVLVSGHKFVGKLSSKDDILLKYISSLLIAYNPEFENLIHFEEEYLTHVDAIIATGGNNTSRYFEYYFGKYSHIIRKNRSSVAILSGNESDKELKGLADDIFLYFGLGCRNISKIYIPYGYDFKKFFNSIEYYKFVIDHNKYGNNYDYNKTIYLINKVTHMDNGFILLKEDQHLVSPISVLFYQYYKDIKDVKEEISLNSDKIQCVVTTIPGFYQSVPFGKTQFPGLNDYADNIDTMEFLTHL